VVRAAEALLRVVVEAVREAVVLQVEEAAGR
jgi:hypothetical protein